MPVVGTAGHVDHGKSTLILALTGRDPDRWEEEKRRGLTLDLGFSWMALPNGVEVSFVDVPGHERYMKNMLAGVDSLDAALLVVAADEGWMPQTEEHLAVLDLLDVRRCVVALTKVDIVGPDRVADARDEIIEQLAGTSLEDALIVPVSAPAGKGIEQLVGALGEALAGAEAPDLGRPRLWVDRSFSVAGTGTVVTGTLSDGVLSVGDHVMVLPDRLECRVRSLQTHERPVDTVLPGRRAAIGLVGVGRRDVPRGAMIGRPQQWDATDHALVRLRRARYVDQLGEKGAYQLHIGSGMWPTRLRMLGADLALVRLAEPVCLEVDDRFVLRDVGARQVVGAGRILDPSPLAGRRLRDALPVLTSILERSRDERAHDLLEIRGMDRVVTLSAHTGGGRPQGALENGGIALSETLAEAKAIAAERLVSEYHDTHPLEPGIPKATLASRLRLPPPLLTRLLGQYGSLVEAEGVVSLRAFTPAPTDAERRAWEAARAQLTASALSPPPISALGLSEPMLWHLERAGALVRIVDDVAYLPEHVDRLLAAVISFDAPFTVSEFRQRAGITRRHAVPFLEWCDSRGVTRRDGDLRVNLGRRTVADGEDGGGGRESNPPGVS